MRPNRYHVRKRPDTTGCCQCRPEASDDVEKRRNPRLTLSRSPWDRTNNLRVERPTGRQTHTTNTRLCTSSAESQHPPLGRHNGLTQHKLRDYAGRARSRPRLVRAQPPQLGHRLKFTAPSTRMDVTGSSRDRRALDHAVLVQALPGREQLAQLVERGHLDQLERYHTLLTHLSGTD